jgi:hypothetical protein
MTALFNCISDRNAPPLMFSTSLPRIPHGRCAQVYIHILPEDVLSSWAITCDVQGFVCSCKPLNVQERVKAFLQVVFLRKVFPPNVIGSHVKKWWTSCCLLAKNPEILQFLYLAKRMNDFRPRLVRKHSVKD